jgi:hypothetical protein
VKLESLDHRLTQRIDRTAGNIEAVPMQIGTFTGGLTRLELQNLRGASSNARLQAQSVDRLIARLEKKG